MGRASSTISSTSCSWTRSCYRLQRTTGSLASCCTSQVGASRIYLRNCLTHIGFVFFVYSLQKGHYKFQFTQFAWTHMALFLIVGQAHFVINNIFEGMIWFFLPVALVITNDIFAYICGITFGRTPLIKISPKKTWEGFLGAWFFTIIFGIIFTSIMARSTYFICPVNVRYHLINFFFTANNCRTSAPT